MTGDRVHSNCGDGSTDRSSSNPASTDRSSARLTRRRFLALAGAGGASTLAGCGYQPGGGELDWERTVGFATFGPGRSRDDREWIARGDRFFSIRNRDGQIHDFDRGFVDVEDAQVTAYDSAGDTRWSGEAPRQSDGDTAVDADSVYVPLEDGSVCAIARASRDRTDGGGSKRGRGNRPSDSTDDAVGTGDAWWTTEPLLEGSLDLIAGDGLVVGTDGIAVVALEAETGDERFTVGGSLAGDVSAIETGAGYVWVATGGDDPALIGTDADGEVSVDLSLPSTARWLETAGSTVLVGIRDEGVWGVDGAEGTGGPDSVTPRFTLEHPPGQESVVVGDRLYTVSGGALSAIDVAAGDLAWQRESYSFSGPILADADGVYGHGSGPNTDRCGLFALTDAGDDWWSVPSYDDLGCAGDCLLVGDRLVVVDDRNLYGFRATPGRRYSIL